MASDITHRVMHAGSALYVITTDMGEQEHLVRTIVAADEGIIAVEHAEYVAGETDVLGLMRRQHEQALVRVMGCDFDGMPAHGAERAAAILQARLQGEEAGLAIEAAVASAIEALFVDPPEPPPAEPPAEPATPWGLPAPPHIGKPRS